MVVRDAEHAYLALPRLSDKCREIAGYHVTDGSGDSHPASTAQPRHRTPDTRRLGKPRRIRPASQIMAKKACPISILLDPGWSIPILMRTFFVR